MSEPAWKKFLDAGKEVVAPWIGGQRLALGVRSWTIDGKLPEEEGWYTWSTKGRVAELKCPAEPNPDLVTKDLLGKDFRIERGFLVGDRIVPDVLDRPGATITLDRSIPVHLIEPGLGRFCRIAAGVAWVMGPLIFKQLEFPLGHEEEVTRAFEDGATSVSHIKGVTPALEVAFELEVWRREMAEKRRQALEKRLREEAEKRARDEALANFRATAGAADVRREMAKRDFPTAARAALAVTNTEYLDARPSHRKGEWVVKFRLERRRFECVVKDTLQVVEAGICLIDHRRNEYDHSKELSLEALPAVYKEAIQTGRLVVFRHVD